MLGKKYIIRLKSSDGTFLRPNTLHPGLKDGVQPIGGANDASLGNEVCDVIFDEKKLGLHSLFRNHEGKWNCRISYFGMYAAKGVRVLEDKTPKAVQHTDPNDPANDLDGFVYEKGRASKKCAGIDVFIDQFHSPYFRTSSVNKAVCLGTINPDYPTQTDETNANEATDTGPDVEPVGYYAGANECAPKTIDIQKDGNITLRLRSSTKDYPDTFSRLISFDEEGDVVRLPDFAIELELAPYYETDARD